MPKIPMTIMRLLTNYSSRQVDIILCDPDDLETFPANWELKKLIAHCEEIYDYDTLSTLNTKYDFDELFKTKKLPEISDEEITAQEDDIVSFMKVVNPSFQMPEAKERKPKK